MSLFRITRDNFEFFTIEAHPQQSFSSSSAGITGSVRVFPRVSPYEKETGPLSPFAETTFDDQDLDALLNNVREDARVETDIEGGLSSYLDGVNNQSRSARKQKELEIIRFEPSVSLSDSTLMKSAVINNLMPYYRVNYPSSHFSYPNYHCLNFFTASSVPSNSAIVYESDQGGYNILDESGKGFSFDFYINPRYTVDSAGDEFKVGTLIHLSGSYTLSVLTGSSVDINGVVDSFRLLLQLSSSADISPSTSVAGDGLTFLSDDNSLDRNNWHHVTVRWDPAVNSSTGSFLVDGNLAGQFVPTGSLSTTSVPTPQSLHVGNYSDLDHPLNAEFHELKIYDKYLSEGEIDDLSQTGPDNLDDLLFYLPPFFTKESSTRRVFRTPFDFVDDSTTEDPFNVDFSFRVGGHLLNLENFLRDFATGIYPSALNLTGSEITGTAQEALSANDYIYATGSLVKRNLTVLPCDNGLFLPNFDLLLSGTDTGNPGSTSPLSKFVNDFGNLDLGLISLRNLVPDSDVHAGILFESGSIFDGIVGVSPTNISGDVRDVPAILQRTRDNSSNEIVFFDISNLYYGNQIDIGSLEISDSSVTGSDGKISITLRDNGRGGVYRADSLTEHADWNHIGNIFYNEGIVLVKTPSIPFFGKDQYDISFSGTQNIHVFRVNVPAPANMINSSSNPSFQVISASLDANDLDPNFVYITGINFHDDNLNVIMRTTLAQPIVKRHSDKLLFKTRIDF